jgi:hypothetical protein
VLSAFEIQVKYQRGIGEKWSNVWRVDAADLVTASSAGNGAFLSDLLPLLDSSCKIVEVLARTPGVPGAFITTALDLAGTSSGSGSVLPLFCAAKVLFPDIAGGRPDFKYLKGFLTESITENEQINTGTVGFIESQVIAAIGSLASAGAPPINPRGHNYSLVTPQAAIQMRQMHRKRRRSA